MTELFRFPEPWRVVELEDAFRIDDASGVALAHVFFSAAAEQSSAVHRMSKDDAYRVAIQIAAIPTYKRSIHESSLTLQEMKRRHAKALSDMQMR